ncbi:putative polysaccharide biosynthesis protein [Alkalihalobacillus deserti]|uniref:putative polysaccharide biosynthesis protein n=1 Tax=Alkalihalobacillus deserti TaxID=2879466 RepID=UPI001D13EB7D|nr:polysaccharide biosynthesis protein [Alkalihalobacillus deserti]
MQGTNSNNRSVLKGIALLSGVALLAKILSAAYRIPYQNLSGDLGFYVYQQVYPLYGIIMVLAMYGFPVVLSKQRAELLASGKEEEARKIMSLFFYGLLLFSAVAWFSLFTFAKGIAFMMGDIRLATPIRAMSYVVLLLPFLSVGRGFHQGEGDLIPTAVSHIAEQFMRVLFILGFTYVFVQLRFDAYTIGTGAAYGSVFGGIAGVLLLLFLTKARWVRQLVHPFDLNFLSMMKRNFALMKQSIFICITALILVLFQLIDAFTVVRLLQKSSTIEIIAFEAKGVFDRSQPLLQLGTILTTTLTLALVPMLSKAVMEGHMALARKYQNLSYRLTILVGGAATVGLFVIIEPTNYLLFTDTTGTNVLRVMSLAILFSSLFTTISAVLQGYNYTYLPAIAVVLGVFIKFSSNFILIPIYGTLGAAWSTVLAVILMVAFLLLAFKKKKSLYLGFFSSYVPIICVLGGMGLLTFLWKNGLTSLFSGDSRELSAIIALSSAGFGGAIVAICLFTMPIFTEEEWGNIPKLNKVRVRLKKLLH